MLKEIEIDKDLEKQHKDWIDLATAKHKPLIKRTKKHMDRLRQKFPPMTDDDNQSIYNFYIANLKRLVPALFPKEIAIKVTPDGDQDQLPLDDGQTFDNRMAATILENKLTSIFKKEAVKYALQAGIVDLIVANFGCIIVGQETELEKEKVIPEGMQNLLQEKADNGDLIPGEMPAPETEIKGVKKSELVIKRDSYRNIMVDPDSVDWFFSDARFFVRVVRIPYTEAKKKYGDIVPKDSYDSDEDFVEIDSNDPNETSLKDKEAAKKTALYEIYDFTDGIKRYTYLGKCSKLLDVTDLSYQSVHLCKLNYLPDVTYPPNDMYYYDSLVDENNFYSTVKMNQISRSGARKIIVDSEALDPDNQEKMASDKDMEMVTVKTSGRSLRDVAQVWESGRTTPEIDTQKAGLAQSIQEISGVNSLRLGQVVNAPATNATIANNSFESQNDRLLETIKDWLTHVCEATVEVLKKLAIESESFVLENNNGVREVITWSNKDIANAKVKIAVDFSAALPDDVKMKRIFDWTAWVSQPAISAGLAAEGKKIRMFELVKLTGSYFLPNVNFDRIVVEDQGLINPEQETLMMIAGQQVNPLPNEDFQKHLQHHQQSLQHPAIAGNPMFIQMIQAHMAATQDLMNQQQALTQPTPTADGEPGGAVEGNMSGALMEGLGG